MRGSGIGLAVVDEIVGTLGGKVDIASTLGQGTDVYKRQDDTKLVGQHVQLVITECAGRKIVGSINKVTAEVMECRR